MKSALKSAFSKRKAGCPSKGGRPSPYWFMAMQKIMVLFIAVLLSGCTPAPRQAYGDMPAAQETVADGGWDTLKILSASECGAGPTPPEREEAVEMSECVTRLVKEYVLPKAAFPELLLASRKEALRIARNYAGGRISSEEYRKQSENRLRSYRDSLIYLIHQKPAHAAG